MAILQSSLRRRQHKFTEVPSRITQPHHITAAEGQSFSHQEAVTQPSLIQSSLGIQRTVGEQLSTIAIVLQYQRAYLPTIEQQLMGELLL